MKRNISKLTFAVITLIFTTCYADDFVLCDNEILDVNIRYDNGVLWDLSMANLLNDGYIDNAYTNNSASLNITEENAHISHLYTYDNSDVNIINGYIGAFEGYNNSNICFNGGDISNLKSYESCIINIYGGELYHLAAYNNSCISIYGGEINSLSAEDESNINISDGTINSLNSDYNYSGNIIITGGTINYIAARNGSAFIYGKNFRSTGGLTIVDNRVLGTGLLTGQWLNSDTTWTMQIQTNNDNATIQLANKLPEPTCGDADHPYPPMDFNHDCIVDFYDFALFMSHWLDCTTPDCIED